MQRCVDLGNAGLRYSMHPGAETATDHAGPPALLLHPWFGCHQMWSALAERLDVPSYAPDWYSLGRGDPTVWASPEALARATIRLIDDRALDRVDVIGNSVGGIVAQILAADYPDRVRRLVLIGTGADLSGDPTPFGALVSRWIESPQDRPALTVRLVDALVARPHSETDRQRYVAAILDADPEFMAHVLTAARRTDLRPRLKDISASTLVIRGEHDSARTAAHVAGLVAGIASARAVEMAGCGHSPMIEDPDAVAALVLNHLRS